jgi:hypothetical protein
MNASDWVKAGTADAAPVTSVTPEVPAPIETAAVETPAAPATPVAAAAPVTPDAPVAAAPVVETPAPTVSAVPAAPMAPAERVIEGRVNGEPFQLKIPTGLELPVKRNGEVAYDPFDQVLSERMMQRDYRLKTAELAEQKRQFALQEQLFQARAKALEAFRDEQISRLSGIATDPEAQLRHQVFAEAAKNDPWMQGLLNDAAMGRAASAEQQVYTEQMETARLQGAVSAINADIADVAAATGVNPDRIRERYAFDLQMNNAPLDRSAIERIAAEEAQYQQTVATAAIAPLQKQLEELTAKIAGLSAASAAETHNQNTAAAIARATTNIGAPVPSVGAPTPAPASTRLTGSTIAQRSQSWAAIR